jgi:hypothetical protein
MAMSIAACGAAAATPTAPIAQAFAIRTPAVQPQACMEALMVGSLERNPQTGLGITTAAGATPVEWPFGYHALLGEGSAVFLLDGTGKVVAREHDRVHVGGGLGVGPVWFACGEVTVESNVGG